MSGFSNSTHRIERIYKILLLGILSSFIPIFSSFGQTPVISVEAENGVFSGGVKKATLTSGYSGTGYVTNFQNSNDKVTVTVNVATKGYYDLKIRYKADSYKEQYVYVNGGNTFTVKFPAVTVFSDADAGKVLLHAGDNSITLQSYWGWTDIDKFSLYSVTKHTYQIAAAPVNSKANSAVVSLYNFLVSKFTVDMISGQTDSYFDSLKLISGKTPILRDFDFQHYTQGYSYKWANGGFAFGWDDNGQTQAAIDWYNNTGKKVIVAFQWHWHSPSGGTVGTNTFYVANTTFDASQAVIAGTQENKDAIRDIDSIATQLKKLQKAGVPVLFRPLHEASGSGSVDGSGAWFWWGAKGTVVCKKLFNIIYDRLTNYYGLNNLLWVWSSPEAAWYPGNDSIDIVGYDSYPGAYNYDTQINSFDQLYNISGGKKLIALSENGPIPNPDDCLTLDVPWSYFMSWANMVASQNSRQHIIDVFANPKVLTLENPTTVKEIVANHQPQFLIYPNPAKETVQISGESFSSLELINMAGQTVYETNIPVNAINVRSFDNGVYLLRINCKTQVYQQKLIISK